MNLHNAQFVVSAASLKDCPKDELPRVVFAGRSNVGKSSVINRLLLRKNFARVGEAPGKTTHINFFLIDESLYLVDLPGYGYAKVSMAEKQRWAKLMERFFAAERMFQLGILVVDARHVPTQNDVTMARYFLDSERPFVVVANKLDKLRKGDIVGNLEAIRQTLQLPQTCKVIPFSAQSGEGREELLQTILQQISID